MIALMMLKGCKPLKRLVLSVVVGLVSFVASATGQLKVDKEIAYYSETARVAAE